jgi:hypothetical protein
MAGPLGKAAQHLDVLRTTVASTTDLITQLLASFPALECSKTDPPQQKDAARQENNADKESCNIDALRLARDAASLIRAHSTKLSLLIINEPFTPSAITTVLRELAAGPLPGLASAVQLCVAFKYTKAMSRELHWVAKNVLAEMGTIVKAVPLDGKTLSSDQKNGTGKATGKGSLAVTGVVWEACDAVLELHKLGVAGLMIKRAEQYRDLVKDALEELQEWGEEQSDDEDDDEQVPSTEHEDELGMSAQDALDDLLASNRHIPADDPEKIRPRLESCNKRLRLIITMYQAVIKRRIKTLPSIPHPPLPEELRTKTNEDPGIVNCLDELIDVFKKIPDITDELASAFYDLDGQEIDKRMDQCFFTGFAAAELLIKNWEGSEDEFTVWV